MSRSLRSGFLLRTPPPAAAETSESVQGEESNQETGDSLEELRARVDAQVLELQSRDQEIHRLRTHAEMLEQQRRRQDVTNRSLTDIIERLGDRVNQLSRDPFPLTQTQPTPPPAHSAQQHTPLSSHTHSHKPQRSHDTRHTLDSHSNHPRSLQHAGDNADDSTPNFLRRLLAIPSPTRPRTCTNPAATTGDDHTRHPTDRPDPALTKLKEQLDEIDRRLHQFSRSQGNDPQPSQHRAQQAPSDTSYRNKAKLGCDLKLDTYDGSLPLRDFLVQFELFARMNSWTDEEKLFALSASLRGQARAVFDNFKNPLEMDYASLKENLELRFGERGTTQSFYNQFNNRRQQPGEDFAALAGELERLCRLAYPDCPYEVRDKIACSQFITAIFDNSIRLDLQKEGTVSLKRALSRAIELKIFKDTWRKNATETHQTQRNPKRSNQKNQECWNCHDVGHLSFECPRRINKEN